MPAPLPALAQFAFRPHASTQPGTDSIGAGLRAGASRGVHDDPMRTDLDSVSLANPPVPDPIAQVFQFLFNDVPQWVQIGGVVLAAVLALAVVVLLWRHRAQISGWLRTRSRVAKIALASMVGLIAMTVVGAGAATWNYMQHDNDFCVGCHVMTPAFERFQRSEHRRLECHDCHQQSIWASAMELYAWVLHRPEQIPPHARVPDAICAECHIQDRPDSAWQRISATAGHRIHLESDSSALSRIQCVTCHGAAVHEFAAADSTCGQSACHQSTPIRLAGMRGQTSLHCATCHQFIAPVNEQAALDTARALIVPAEGQCLGCHEMQARMPSFHPEAEPHRAVCGTCHNPHEQETPEAAFETCAASGCHARADTITVFHRGIRAAALADCGSCHKAHTWHAEAGSCLGCHADVFSGTGVRTAATERHGAEAGLGFVSELPMSHRRHRELECTACHSAGGDRHGQLTVRTTADCQQCHHTPTRAATGCTSCHQPGEIGGVRQVTTTLQVAANVRRVRPLPFRHAEHDAIRCEGCHAPSPSMAPTTTCTSCHAPHHEATASCRSCHATSTRAVHTRQAHLGCVGCHDAAKVASLRPTREVCLSCHVDMNEHNPGRECTQCHQVAWRPAARAAGSE